MTLSVLLSMPKALLAMHVKLPISEAWILPIKKWELNSLVVILYFECVSTDFPLCSHLNSMGVLPLLTAQKISVISPTSMFVGTSSGFRTGASLAEIPKEF